MVFVRHYVVKAFEVVHCPLRVALAERLHPLIGLYPDRIFIFIRYSGFVNDLLKVMIPTPDLLFRPSKPLHLLLDLISQGDTIAKIYNFPVLLICPWQQNIQDKVGLPGVHARIKDYSGTVTPIFKVLLHQLRDAYPLRLAGHLRDHCRFLREQQSALSLWNRRFFRYSHFYLWCVLCLLSGTAPFLQLGGLWRLGPGCSLRLCCLSGGLRLCVYPFQLCNRCTGAFCPFPLLFLGQRVLLAVA